LEEIILDNYVERQDVIVKYNDIATNNILTK
jgi:hypothetical protein